MWIVKKVGFITRNGETIYDSFQYLSKTAYKFGYTVVHLSNTETGDLRVIYSNNPDEYMSVLKQLEPYGYFSCDPDLYVSTSLCGDIFIEIDDSSLQFLGYVSGVSTGLVKHEFKDYIFKDKSVPSLESLNTDMTLFACNTNTYNGTCFCTLLSAMLFCPGSWDGDDFVMVAKTVADFQVDGYVVRDVTYRVSFNDVDSAKALYTKCLLAGENPVKLFATRDFLG